MASPRVLLPPLLALAVLAAGCAAPAACDRLDRFEGHAPGFFEALHAIPSEVADVGPERGHPLPALEAHLPHSTLRAVRYVDPDSDLRHAAVRFDGPQAPARVAVTVPTGDDRPEPLFDAVWDALGFEDDRAAARAALLASRAEAGDAVRYEADAAPPSAVEDHLDALGGVAAADQTTLPNGTVLLAWTDWTYEASVMVHDWRPRGGPVHRVDSLPHGPLAVLVPSGLGWTPTDAEAWLRERGAVHGLPTDGVVLERVATVPCA